MKMRDETLIRLENRLHRAEWQRQYWRDEVIRARKALEAAKRRRRLVRGRRPDPTYQSIRGRDKRGSK